MEGNVLKITNLSLNVDTHIGQAKILDDISFELKKGKITCLVGESGCGKSLTALTVMGLQHPINQTSSSSSLSFSGSISFNDTELLSLDEPQFELLRGQDIAMIFQEPMTSLNPTLTIGDQLKEAVITHNPSLSESVVEELVVETLLKVQIQGKDRLKEYPYQLSGGMRQRVMIAMAIINKPKLLIADEPTTALDVTVQAQIIQLLKKLQEEEGMSILLITHDLGVVANIADETVVMYGGQIVEQGKTSLILESPQHPYIIGLLNSIPRIGENINKLNTIEGLVPPVTEMPSGCRFRTRCPMAQPQCEKKPSTTYHQNEHKSTCWFTPLESFFTLNVQDESKYVA
ncbi:ABC transporter ATP-binding protein [Vibrio sp. SS-MA-C1-2]|uniref:ABC transporter ATP-binding protein n=1 Tax=Vibrio sp. SS-MA-C1-2 TaxID=2908646 RepID=UPI001F188E20|nr:ABC transporter ATP-binding protein [Vibrio sp. SS-MA-C1-2]UJF17893.1 ABC transporter ATP-binding protein [Vibrio sp. SS-MA-C1-2]